MRKKQAVTPQAKSSAKFYYLVPIRITFPAPASAFAETSLNSCYCEA